MPSAAALDLIVSLKDNASKGLDEIAQKGGGLGDLIGKGAGIAAGGILALGGVLIGAAGAANEEQVGMDRLGVTLKNNIPNWKGSEDAVEGYVAKMEGMAFADDQIRDSLNQLIPRTHDLAEAQNLQATAMDLARAKGIDLETATSIIGKVYSGNIGILARYGIAVDKNATSTEALAAIQQSSKGQAEAYANSAAGSMDRLKTSFGDAFETIGHAVLSIAQGPLKAFADWLSSPAVQAGIQQVADFIGGALTTAFNILGQIVQTVWPIIQPFFDAIVGFFQQVQGGGDIGAALGTMFSNLGTAIANAWNIVGPALGQLLGNILGWIGAHAGDILGTLGSWALAFGGWIFGTATPWMLQQLGNLIAALWNWIVANGPSILAQLGQWAQAFGAWIWNTAIPAMLNALGTLITALWNFITTNGPTILATLGQWALAFGGWVFGTAIPWLFQQLGALIVALWNWITQNGPTILAKLVEWGQAFGDWIVTKAIPWLFENFNKLILLVWNWITENGPKILNKLLEWGVAFGDWVWNKAIPWLVEKLGDLLGKLWAWISDTAPKLLTKLGEWAQSLWNLFTMVILPKLPEYLGQIVSKLWEWLTQTAKDLGSKLVNEWIPAFWNWITGKGGVLEGAGKMLGDVAQKIWGWITQTAKDAWNKVLEIGGNIVSGIKQGIINAWDAFTKWILGLLGDLLGGIVKFFTGGSPFMKFAWEVGEPMVQGIQVGWASAFPALRSKVLGDLGGLMQAASGGTIGIGTSPGSGMGIGVGEGLAFGLAGGPGWGNQGSIGLHTGDIHIYAGPGVNGGQLASEFIEALSHEIGVSEAIRIGKGRR